MNHASVDSDIVERVNGHSCAAYRGCSDIDVPSAIIFVFMVDAPLSSTTIVLGLIAEMN